MLKYPSDYGISISLLVVITMAQAFLTYIIIEIVQDWREDIYERSGKLMEDRLAEHNVKSERVLIAAFSVTSYILIIIANEFNPIEIIALHWVSIVVYACSELIIVMITAIVESMVGFVIDYIYVKKHGRDRGRWVAPITAVLCGIFASLLVICPNVDWTNLQLPEINIEGIENIARKICMFIGGVVLFVDIKYTIKMMFPSEKPKEKPKKKRQSIKQQVVQFFIWIMTSITYLCVYAILRITKPNLDQDKE